MRDFTKFWAIFNAIEGFSTKRKSSREIQGGFKNLFSESLKDKLFYLKVKFCSILNTDETGLFIN